MTQTHPIRLSPDQIERQARKFFGSEDLGMDLVIDEVNRLRFEGREGFIELEIRPDTNNQTRLTIENQGYEREIHDFRRLLSRQASAETRAE